MPNFSGKWKANLERSKLLPGPQLNAPTSIFIEIDHSGQQLKEEIFITSADGTENRVMFTCETTGEEGHSTLNGNNVLGKASWKGEELIIESSMQLGDREFYFRDCWRVSEDGRTLIMEHRDDALAGQVILLERSA